MKKVIALLLVSMLFVGMAFATCPKCPPGPVGPQGNAGKDGTDFDRKMPLGMGMDVTLLENKDQSVALISQYKYDFNNQEHSIFGVITVNPWKLLEKK